jgi:hypothetical protein
MDGLQCSIRLLVQQVEFVPSRYFFHSETSDRSVLEHAGISSFLVAVMSFPFQTTIGTCIRQMLICYCLNRRRISMRTAWLRIWHMLDFLNSRVVSDSTFNIATVLTISSVPVQTNCHSQWLQRFATCQAISYRRSSCSQFKKANQSKQIGFVELTT